MDGRLMQRKRPREMRRGAMARATIAAATLLLATLALGGCETTTATSASTGRVIDDYEAGRFAQAYEGASALAARSSGSTRAEAQYLAGMSAYRLGRDDEAMRYLSGVTRASSDTIAGPASATLGLIYARKGEHRRALGYYRTAVRRLSGNDLAHAYYHMARTEQKLGLWADARTHLSMSMSKATSQALRDTAREQLNATGFTIQFGAFTRPENARKLAAEVTTSTRRAGLGEPRIVEVTDHGGRRWHKVIAGQYTTFESAAKAKRLLHEPDARVTTIAGR